MTQDQLPGTARPSRRRWWAGLGLAAWTVGALAAAWWLAKPAAGGVDQPFWFDGSKAADLPLGDRIRVGLRLADASLRGAYPWLLLAPYVAWLAVKFPWERGRLRVGLPVHLVAAGLFATGSWLLSARVETRSVGLVVMSSFKTEAGTSAPPAGTTAAARSNPPAAWHFRALRLPDGPVPDTNLLSALGAGLNLAGGSMVATSLPPAALSRTLPGRGMDQEVFRTETNLNSSANVINRRDVSWSDTRMARPKPLALLLDLLAYGSLAGSAHAVHYYRRFREREQRALQLESHLARARLHALHAQLHPHFLFNALNAVATLIRHDANAALDTLTSFSDLLRLALSQSEKQEVPLREDLRFLARYVEIQQVRLGARLRFESDVEPAALDCLVPALLLQPLVENAIRHGLEPSPHPGWARLTARRQGARLALTVTDNGAGLVPAAVRPPGIGLANLRARLELLYGSDQRLEIRSRPEGGVEVQLEIPWRHGSTPVVGEGAVP